MTFVPRALTVHQLRACIYVDRLVQEGNDLNRISGSLMGMISLVVCGVRIQPSLFPLDIVRGPHSHLSKIVKGEIRCASIHNHGLSVREPILSRPLKILQGSVMDKSDDTAAFVNCNYARASQDYVFDLRTVIFVYLNTPTLTTRASRNCDAEIRSFAHMIHASVSFANSA
jgi:hypothetical protein